MICKKNFLRFCVASTLDFQLHIDLQLTANHFKNFNGFYKLFVNQNGAQNVKNFIDHESL